MDNGLMVYRLLLAVPLAVAGVTRLYRRRGGRVWAATEIAAALGLLSGATALPAALLALGLLLVPAIPLAVGLARPGGAAVLPAVLRAGVLAVPAVLVLWDGYPDPGPGLFTWLAALSAPRQITVLAGVAALAVVCARPNRRAPPPAPPAAVPLIRRPPELTIGMATYDDFDGVYFTLQALRLYHDLDNVELLVVDNYGCADTRELVRSWVGGTYCLAGDVVGTAAAKDLVVRAASGTAVLCCDSHVLFAPGVIARLKQYHREHPDGVDLLQGPLVYDDGRLMSTHFDPGWSQQMWGTWATDPRGADPDGEPFEIPMQGLGAFSCRTEAWPGFHPGFRGFGGEEGYLHEKFRRAGGRCLCLPWLRWMHRFGRPRGVPYPLTVEDKLRNYVLGHVELGLDLAPLLEHFGAYLPPDRVSAVAEAAAGERLP